MANRQADTCTALGIVASVLFAPATGGASLLGIPAVLGARALRGAMDAANNNNDDENERRNSSMNSLVPYRSNHPMLLDDDDRFPAWRPSFTGLGPQLTTDLISPRSILARTEPLELLRFMEREADEKLLVSITRSLSPSIEMMVARHPCPRHLHVRGKVRRTFFGGTKFDIDVDID